MQNLIPIQITLQAANAADARQLVQDLAGTMATSNLADLPPRTDVTAVPAAAPFAAPAAPVAVPTAAVAYQQAPATPGYAAAAYQQAPVTPPPTQPPVQTATQPYPYTDPLAPAVPVAAQTYSTEQLAVAATQLMDAGRRQDLVNLLASFGVEALTALPKEQYGAFATQLRTLGAKI